MTEYTLMADFHIDGGELDGTPPNEAFVLGVEWQQVRSIVSTLSEIPAAIDIHKANAGRLVKLCAAAGLSAETTPSPTEGWCVLNIKEQPSDNVVPFRPQR